MSDNLTDAEINTIVDWCEGRPANCRFRLRDEGKPYPRSGCAGCNGSVFSGFRPECLPSGAPTHYAIRAMGNELLELRAEHGLLCICEDEHRNAVNALAAAEAKVKTLMEALGECEDYFNRFADADCDQDGFIPNEAMNMLSIVKTALGEL